jgi:flavorubredoxin
VSLYDEWSSISSSINEIPIFYASAYGYTKKIAQAIAEGIKTSNSSLSVNLYDINEFDINKLSNIINKAKYFGIGSPTLNRSVVAPIVNLLTTIDTINSNNKQAFVFGSYGWSGEAVNQITQYLKSIRINTFNDGLRIKFLPSNDELEKAKVFGKDFTTIIK